MPAGEPDALTSLPESIGNLTGLTSLDVSSTKLTSLPESIGNLTGLQSLDVSETRIASLPESLEKLSSLRKLPLQDLSLDRLPDSIRIIHFDFKTEEADIMDKLSSFRKGIYIHNLYLSKQPITLFYQKKEN